MKAEINSQVTAVNLDENKNSKSFIFFGHLSCVCFGFKLLPEVLFHKT